LTRFGLIRLVAISREAKAQARNADNEKIAAHQELFPHEQPTNEMRTAAVQRIIQHREIMSQPRGFSLQGLTFLFARTRM
jgi:hypothetical protein